MIRKNTDPSEGRTRYLHESILQEGTHGRPLAEKKSRLDGQTAGNMSNRCRVPGSGSLVKAFRVVKCRVEASQESGLRVWGLGRVWEVTLSRTPAAWTRATPASPD